MTEAQKNQIVTDMLKLRGGRGPQTPDTTTDEEIAAINITLELADPFDQLLKNADKNQHCSGDSASISFRDICRTTAWGLIMMLDDSLLFELYYAWLNQMPLAEPLSLTRNHSYITCPECAKEMNLLTDGIKIWVEEPCSEIGGIKPFTTRLNVPSGKIVMANDLRDLYKDMEEIDSDDMCTRAGLRGVCKDYERVGLVHGFCGNSGVELFEKNGGYILDYQKNMGKKKSLAPLTTDLWWYCFADHDDFLKRKGGRKKNYREFVFEVEPGVYEFTHYGHLGNGDSKLSQKVEFKRISSL